MHRFPECLRPAARGLNVLVHSCLVFITWGQTPSNRMVPRCPGRDCTVELHCWPAGTATGGSESYEDCCLHLLPSCGSRLSREA